MYWYTCALPTVPTVCSHMHCKKEAVCTLLAMYSGLEIIKIFYKNCKDVGMA